MRISAYAGSFFWLASCFSIGKWDTEERKPRKTPKAQKKRKFLRSCYEGAAALRCCAAVVERSQASARTLAKRCAALGGPSKARWRKAEEYEEDEEDEEE